MDSIPPGVNSSNVIGLGTTGVVAVLPCTRKVIKFPHSEPDARARCEVEVKVYERLEQTPELCSTILRYYGHSKHGIILEYAENGSLREYLRTSAGTPSKALLLRWAQQAAQALVFCHASGILHGDINCSNLFLDGKQNLKLGDFAGSSIDGSLATICYSTTHQLPTSDSLCDESEGVIITKDTEIFAFGSTLYEMVTGRPPYDDKSDSEVERLFCLREYPICDTTFLGSIILRCWNVEFDSMEDVLESIKQSEGTQTFITCYDDKSSKMIIISSGKSVQL